MAVHLVVFLRGPEVSKEVDELVAVSLCDLRSIQRVRQVRVRLLQRVPATGESGLEPVFINRNMNTTRALVSVEAARLSKPKILGVC